MKHTWSHGEAPQGAPQFGAEDEPEEPQALGWEKLRVSHRHCQSLRHWPGWLQERRAIASPIACGRREDRAA